MKNLNLLLILFCLAFIACNKPNPDLLKAENRIFLAPDSVFKVLNNYPPEKHKYGSNNALFALLMTQCNSIYNRNIFSDSLITIATDYFTPNDPKRAAMAWLYKCRISALKGYNKDAVNELLIAQKYADISKDEFIQNMILGNKAYFYRSESQNDSALGCVKKSYKYAVKLNDKKIQIDCLISIAEIYSDMNKFDSAINNLKIVEKFAKEINNNFFLQSTYNELVLAYLRKNDLHMAQYYARLTPIDSKSLNSSHYSYLYLATIYYSLHKTDSANYYLNKIDQMFSSDIDYLKLRKKISDSEGNIAKAKFYTAKIIHVEDSINKEKLNARFVDLEQKFKYQSIDLENKKLIIRNKQNNILLLLSLLVLSVFGVFISFWRLRIKQKQYDYQRNIAEKERSLLEKERENNLLLEQQLKVQRILLLNVEQYKKTSISHTGNKTSDPSHLHEEIITCMDLQYNNVSKRLQDIFPNLSQRDILVCCLLLAGFDTGMIATILDVKNDSILIHRSRLRKKLNLENSENLFDFLSHF